MIGCKSHVQWFGTRGGQCPVLPVLFTLVTVLVSFSAVAGDQFDFRHPRAEDYPGETIAGETRLQLMLPASDGTIEYDAIASFAADELEPFHVDEVQANGRAVEQFSVANGSINNFLHRANAVEDLNIRLLSDWQPGQEVRVTVAGTKPNGKPVTLAVAATAPESKTAGGSITFHRPTPAFPYHHFQAVLGPVLVESATIETIAVNGVEVREYELEQLATTRPDGTSVPARNAFHKVIDGGARFSITAPLRWTSGEEINLTVTAISPLGEHIEFTATTKPSFHGFWNADWKYEASIVVRETAGVARHKEPVEITLGLLYNRVTDPKREIRVVTPKSADSAEYLEVPCQILDVVAWNDEERIKNAGEKDVNTGASIHRYIATTTVQLVFEADVEPYEERIYLICYGNPTTQAPQYDSKLHVVKGQGLGQTVSNEYFSMGLASNSAAVETVVVKGGGPEVLLEHRIETNGAVHWNPGIYSPPTPWVHVSDWENPECSTLSGPVLHRVSRYANLPHMTEVAAHVTYEFFDEQPYLLSSSVMEVKQDLMVQALRNGEVVFNHAVLDEFVWKDALGKVQNLKIAEAKEHPIHALEIPPDTPWLAFISRKAGVGFAGINVVYQNINLYGRLISEAQPYFYVQNGPWIYWSRGIMYPFGHLNFTRMMPVRKGSVYIETIAFAPFRLTGGANPFAEIDRLHTVLTHPLQTREWIDLAAETPKEWIMPLLTMPFDEGVKGAKSSREVPKE